MAIFPGSAIPSAVSDYEIDNSLRFDDSGGYLSKTFAGDGNRRTFTISFWYKTTTDYAFFYRCAGPDDDNWTSFHTQSAAYGQFIFQSRVSNSYVAAITTPGKYRDPAAWYHVVLAIDTTQAVAADRAKLYVNGVSEGTIDTTFPLNHQFEWWQESDTVQNILRNPGDTGDSYSDGYLAEYYYIDGTAYDADDFGELSSTTNQWKPIDASGLTFGTNGFYQKYAGTELANSFTDSSEGGFKPSANISADILIVGGGGGGGRGGGAAGGGGGGAGGFKYFSQKSLTADTVYSVVIGTGGTYQSDTLATLSSFGSDEALPGQGGKVTNNPSTAGSGGGGNYAFTPGGSGTANQGNDGGDGHSSGVPGDFKREGGGGGGAKEAGENASAGSSGDGGDGYSTGDTVYDWNLADGTTVTFPASFTDGSSTTSYAGGGGGVGIGGAAAGGTGGGGAGYAAATANTGGGGGAGDDASSVGQPGGSGIVIVRYQANSAQATGGTITNYGSGASEYYVHTFLSSSLNPRHTITANGDVTNTRAVRKIGESSIKFDGTGDYLTIPNSSDWDMGTGDFTIECWARFDAVGDIDTIIERDFGSNARAFYLAKQADNTILASTGSGSGWVSSITSSSTVAADTWYHIAYVRDGTDFELFIDGASVGTDTDAATMYDSAEQVMIGMHRESSSTSDPFKGYMDEIRISDSARYTGAFTPSTTAFTADSNTKLLIHSNWDGGLGADSSGNYNTFTATNLVATDQMPDTPTRNWCTLNPLDYQGTITASEGNLKAVTNASDPTMKATIGLPSTGKWYWEFLMQYSTSMMIGVVDQTSTGAAYTSNKAVLYSSGLGTKYNFSSVASYGATWTTGDLMGVAFNRDDNEITFYKNNSAQPTLTIGGTADQRSRLIPLIVTGTGGTDGGGTFNFGQDSSFAGAKTAQGNQDANDIGDFYYEPPTDYLALCTDNLPDPEIKLPGENFNTVLYTGDAATTQAVTGVGFQPEFLWLKSRSASAGNIVQDVARGATTRLETNSNGAQVTDATYVASFDSDGFTVGNNTDVNANTATYVARNWKAGGAPVSNGDGDITSSVSANTTAGFSIVSYTGDGDNTSSVGYGLTTTPGMILLKALTGTQNWIVWHKNLTATTGKSLYLNTGAAEVSNTSYWYDAAPNATTFHPGNGGASNGNTTEYIAYCFEEIEGYSKMGSYEGNSSTDGTFICTGFTPAMVFVKNIEAATNWIQHDYKRPGYNVHDKSLRPDGAGAAESNNEVDFLSNGFKWRGDSYPNYDQASNQSGEKYVFYAVAVSPFKYSNAR